ncbi:hypothetical protein [Piscibacillus salipiscarius]|uniref:hypothetical protein n=1 Tax=Piscibacillus salipiscarius TaxID=299480 RepID=UPI0006CFF1F3|nr:hypothetical protein [Piscibacillus salipiscarius]
MVNITPVKEQSPKDYDTFFKKAKDQELFNESWVKEHGYFLELDGQQLGFLCSTQLMIKRFGSGA